VIDKAKSTYNPFRAASFISSLTHDVTLDNKLSATALLSLAERYHAFSGSSLATYTLPTINAEYAPYSEDVEVVEEPQAADMIQQFLGTAPETAATPPLDQYGNPLPTTTGTVATSATSAAFSSGSGTPTTAGSAAVPTNSVPSYDPRPC
jgi:hypothetical protein